MRMIDAASHTLIRYLYATVYVYMLTMSLKLGVNLKYALANSL